MEKTPEIFFLYSTFPNREVALMAARVLVEKNLIACANIKNEVTSLYRWEGKIQQEDEVSMVAKTSHGKLTAAIEELKRLHPYEVPCIVAFPITDGHAPFLKWVAEETR